LICCTSLPLSNTRVFSPFSVSSLAAQPPLIPEPTTMASKDLSFTLRILRLAINVQFLLGFDQHLSLKTSRDHLVRHDFGHEVFRTQIALQGIPFTEVQKIFDFVQVKLLAFGIFLLVACSSHVCFLSL